MRTAGAVLTIFSFASWLNSITTSSSLRNTASSESLALTESESIAETASIPNPAKRRKRSNSLQDDSLIPDHQYSLDLHNFVFDPIDLTVPTVKVMTAPPRSDVLKTIYWTITNKTPGILDSYHR